MMYQSCLCPKGSCRYVAVVLRLCVNLCLPAMVELDGDDIRISSRGKLAERDIVQVTALYSMKETLTVLCILELEKQAHRISGLIQKVGPQPCPDNRQYSLQTFIKLGLMQSLVMRYRSLFIGNSICSYSQYCVIFLHLRLTFMLLQQLCWYIKMSVSDKTPSVGTGNSNRLGHLCAFFEFPWRQTRYKV